MIVYVFETTVHIASLNSVAYNGLSHKLFLDNLLDTDSHSENNNNYESAYHSGW